MSEAEEPETEWARVLKWRRDELEAAGYPMYPAFVLAASDVDLHRAADLLKKGCPIETAIRILT